MKVSEPHQARYPALPSPRIPSGAFRNAALGAASCGNIPLL